jgi:hypothetical protein
MDNETFPAPAEPAVWAFDQDQELIERATTDPRLDSLLKGMRVARQKAHENPNRQTFQTLLARFEQATGEYVVGELGWKPPEQDEQGRP